MIKTITVTTGKIFRRIHDQFEMGESIVLGIDYSTGIAREDKPEYYEEVDAPPMIFDSEQQAADLALLDQLLIEEQTLL